MEMKNKVELLKEKHDAIRELQMQRMDLALKAAKIVRKGASKYPKVTMRRAFQVISIAFHARHIQMQINMIKAQPIEPGGPLSIVGEDSNLIHLHR